MMEDLMENQEQFNEWKFLVEDIEPKNQLDCLRIIELNLSNVCNFRCPFCPHSKGWTVKEPQYMSVETAALVARQLHDINYKGYICTAGFGEPAMNAFWEEILNLFRDFKIVVVSNGSIRKEESWERISKFAQLKISVHYWDQIDWYRERFKNTNAIFRNHDVINPQMNIYNRGGMLWEPKDPTTRMCNLPFYKVFIDTDGTYLTCEADWNHKSITKYYNIKNSKIDEYFVNYLEPVREKMCQEGGRQNLNCCKDCDIQGTLTGQKFVDFWRNRNVK